MRRTAALTLFTALAMFWGTAASAAPEAVTFSLISSVNSGAAFPSVSTYDPPLPIAGSGTIDEAAGTYDLSLSEFTIEINVILAPGDPPDADVNILNWGQVGTFTGAGDMTSSSASGTVTCTDLGGPVGALVCALISPTVATWPPTGASGDFGAPGATIDVATNTIVVTEAYDVNGGQVQNTYTYAAAPQVVPALSDWGMMALALFVVTVGIVVILRRQKLPTA